MLIFKLLSNKYELGATAYGSREAGLPNITGILQFRSAFINGSAYTGAFSAIFQEYKSASTGGGNSPAGANFDASLSNATYGNSTTVQPETINMIPQIKY